MTRFTLDIDHKACWGCKTCEVACKHENNAPDGTKLIQVREIGPDPQEERPDFSFAVDVCRHCDDAPCAEACPEMAITQRDDGIVVLDQDKCDGCRVCADVCPFDAIAFDEENGLAWKCNLCHHRVDQELLPACADNICLAHCIWLGRTESQSTSI